MYNHWNQNFFNKLKSGFFQKLDNFEQISNMLKIDPLGVDPRAGESRGSKNYNFLEKFIFRDIGKF